MLRGYDFDSVIYLEIPLIVGKDPSDRIPKAQKLLERIREDLESEQIEEKSRRFLAIDLGSIFLPDFRAYLNRTNESYQLDFLDSPGKAEISEKYKGERVISAVAQQIKELEKLLEDPFKLSPEKKEGLLTEITEISTEIIRRQSELEIPGYRGLAA